MPPRRYRTDGRSAFRAKDEWPAHPRRLLTAQTIFDANVPIKLAVANRTQMLTTAFATRAHIPDAVRGEISGIAGNRIPAASVLLLPSPFAQVHRLDREGMLRSYDRQVAWKGRTVVEATDGKEGKGEAQCHEIAVRNKGWVVVSQDADALSHGFKKDVPVYGLADILIVFAAQGLCRPDSAWAIYETMCANDDRAMTRYWPLGDDAAASKRLFLDMVADLIANP